jgi:hypothetical protein
MTSEDNKTDLDEKLTENIVTKVSDQSDYEQLLSRATGKIDSGQGLSPEEMRQLLAADTKLRKKNVPDIDLGTLKNFLNHRSLG